MWAWQQRLDKCVITCRAWMACGGVWSPSLYLPKYSSLSLMYCRPSIVLWPSHHRHHNFLHTTLHEVYPRHKFVHKFRCILKPQVKTRIIVSCHRAPSVLRKPHPSHSPLLFQNSGSPRHLKPLVSIVLPFYQRPIPQFSGHRIQAPRASLVDRDRGHDGELILVMNVILLRPNWLSVKGSYGDMRETWP